MTTVDRLRVLYELDDRNFRSGSERMRNQARRTHADIENTATRMQDRTIAGFKGMSAAALSATTSVLSLGLAFSKLNQYTNSYVTIENRLRSIGEFSDEAGEKLLGAAIRARTAVEDMSTATARIQKATQADFETTLRRVETLNKLLAIGGATAGERGSVMLQLSQALTSGVLQGEELRSLRENAPIEVLQALAEAAGASVGELKKLGEEGKLTSDIVIKALDSLAETADKNLSNAMLTTADAFTNVDSAATVFFGRLDEGLGLQERFTLGLQSMAEWLQDNADEAEQLGISFNAAMATVGDYIDDIRSALEDLGIISEDAFRNNGTTTFIEDIENVLEWLAKINATLEGVSAVATQIFYAIGDAVASGLIAGINAVGNAVESMVNSIMIGVKRVAGAIDTITGNIADFNKKLPQGMIDAMGLRTEGTNLEGRINESLDFFTPLPEPGKMGSGETSISKIYDEAYDKSMNAARAGMAKARNDLSRRYNTNRGEQQIYNNAPMSYGELPPSAPPSTLDEDPTRPGGGGGGGGRGSKRKGGGGKGKRGGRADEPFFQASDEDIRNLERQIELIGKSTREQARMRAEWEMLDEAKKRGIPVNETLMTQIQAQAEEMGLLTEQLEQGEISYKRFEEGVEGISDALAGALLAGESFREGFAQVLKGIASDILQSGIKNALMGQLSFGGGGGFFKGLLQSVMGGGDKLLGGLRLAGARANGGPVQAGQNYLVGEKGWEIFRPQVNGTIIPQGKMGGGSSSDMNLHVHVHGAKGNTEIEEMVTNGISNGLARYDKQLPKRIKEVHLNSRKV